MLLPQSAATKDRAAPAYNYTQQVPCHTLTQRFIKTSRTLKT